MCWPDVDVLFFFNIYIYIDGSLIGVFCDVCIYKIMQKNIKRVPIPRKYTLVK